MRIGDVERVRDPPKKIWDPDQIESQDALTSMPLGPWAEEWKTTDVTVFPRGLS